MINKNLIVLKYEDLKKNQCIIHDKLKLFGIDSKRIEIITKIKPGHNITNEKFTETKYKVYTKKTIAVINEYKRIDIEKKMGY